MRALERINYTTFRSLAPSDPSPRSGSAHASSVPVDVYLRWYKWRREVRPPSRWGGGRSRFARLSDLSVPEERVEYFTSFGRSCPSRYLRTRVLERRVPFRVR